MFCPSLTKHLNAFDSNCIPKNCEQLDAIRKKQRGSPKLQKDKVYKWIFEGSVDKTQMKLMIENKILQCIFEFIENCATPISSKFTYYKPKPEYPMKVDLKDVFRLTGYSGQFDCSSFENKTFLNILRFITDSEGNRVICLSRESLLKRNNLVNFMEKVSNKNAFSQAIEIIYDKETNINYLTFPCWFEDLQMFTIEHFFVAMLEMVVYVKYSLSLIENRRVLLLESNQIATKINNISLYEEFLLKNCLNSNDFFEFIRLSEIQQFLDNRMIYGKNFSESNDFTKCYSSFSAHNFLTENRKCSLTTIVQNIFFRKSQTATGDDKLLYDQIEQRLQEIYEKAVTDELLAEPKKKRKKNKTRKVEAAKVEDVVKKNNFFITIDESIESIDGVMEDEVIGGLQIESQSRFSLINAVSKEDKIVSVNFNVETRTLGFQTGSWMLKMVEQENLEIIQSQKNKRQSGEMKHVTANLNVCLTKLLNSIDLKTGRSFSKKEQAVDRVKELICKFAEREVEVATVGSFVTKLSIEQSDVDLAIQSQFMLEQIFSFTKFMQSNPFIHETKAIPSALVPLVKMKVKSDLYDLDDFIEVDLALHKDIKSKENCEKSIKVVREYILKDERVRPLVLIIKKLLQKEGLNLSYKGGLGSYSVTLMVIAFLTGYLIKDLGQSFIDFLDFYGNFLNYKMNFLDFGTSRIICNFNGIVDNNHLIILDGISQLDVNKSSFDYGKVVKMFSEKKKQLVELIFRDGREKDFVQLII